MKQVKSSLIQEDNEYLTILDKTFTSFDSKCFHSGGMHQKIAAQHNDDF